MMKKRRLTISTTNNSTSKVTSKVTNKKSLISLMLGMFVLSQPVFAGTNSPVIDQKEAQQKHRIVQGVKSGELTAKELSRLTKQQRRIYREERRFKADGTFSRRERAKVHYDLARSSHSIYKQKHDRQVQGHHPRKKMSINKRQNKQARRIAQGVGSGSLTARETVRLGKQQVRIQKQKHRYKADGVFTRKERARVQHHQNKASKRIYRLKHNNRKRH